MLCPSRCHGIIATLCTQILRECLASLGLVRGVPEGEFHAMVSRLRDQAEKAAHGFMSVEVRRGVGGGDGGKGLRRCVGCCAELIFGMSAECSLACGLNNTPFPARASLKELHAAAEGARALDAMRSLRVQVMSVSELRV